MKFSEIKDQIKNNRGLNNLKEIKEKGLRIVRNTKTGDYWLIQEEFLKPVIKNLKEIKNIIVDTKTKFLILFCNLNKTNFKNSFIIDYILWGEKNKYNLHPTCKTRKIWYSINSIFGEFLFNMSSGDRYFMPYNQNFYFFDARLYGLELKEAFIKDKMIIILNSSYLPLFFEIYGRTMTGSLPLLDLKVFELKMGIIIKSKVNK